LGIFKIFNVSNFEKAVITSLMNLSSSSLFFAIDLFLLEIYSSTIKMVTVKGA